MAKKTKAQKTGAPQPAGRKKRALSSYTFMVFSTFLAIIFLATTVFLVIGMLPTLLAYIVDKSRGKVKTMTVGAMNLAGCMPFILSMWREDHTLDAAWGYLLEPQTIVAVYSAALIGYLIDWAMTGIVASLQSQQGRRRLENIGKIQDGMIERWGEEVAGHIPVDHDGFPIQSQRGDEEDGGEEQGV